MQTSAILLYAVVALFAAVLLFWGANLWRVLQQKEPMAWLTRAMYLAAILAAGLSAVRSALVYTDKTMLAANLIVLACLAVAFWRAEKKSHGDDESV